MNTPFTDVLIVVAYYAILAVLSVYSVHRLHLVRICRKAGLQKPSHFTSTSPWPSVCVQLPLYNEPNVAVRLIDAALALQYPGVLEIQVLDDSTDETSALVEQRLAGVLPGHQIHHIRRPGREGFKAGALAHGLTLSEASLFLIFDADFLPSPDILLQLVPEFSRADNIGMVQARWGHLNREETLLTRVQALFLDGHFAIESAARYLDGRFFNFNGTAGIWRREAIEQAGGWSASTLTEDLDLSYRAQLAGWRFVFMSEVMVPAELPASLSGFQGQQHRWAKGSIQTARKILPSLLRSRLPLKVKLEALFHLTNNSAYLLTLCLALLLVPSLEIRHRLQQEWILAVDLILFSSSIASLLLFYIEGQKRIGNRRPGWKELVSVMPLGIGLSVTNASAVIEGMMQRGGYFSRTPKHGTTATAKSDRAPRLPLAEALLALFFLGALVIFVKAGLFIGIPFLLLFLSGYGYVAVAGIRERFVDA